MIQKMKIQNYLKKDLDKLKEQIKIKPKHSYPRSHREKNEDDTPTLIYY